jgi:hypothetical protein
MKKLCRKNSLPLHDKELSLNYLFLYLYFILSPRAAELNINAINILKSFSSPVFGFGTGGFSVLGSGSLGAGGIDLSFNMVNPLSALPSYKTLKRLSPDSK